MFWSGNWVLGPVGAENEPAGPSTAARPSKVMLLTCVGSSVSGCGRNGAGAACTVSGGTVGGFVM